MLATQQLLMADSTGSSSKRSALAPRNKEEEGNGGGGGTSSSLQKHSKSNDNDDKKNEVHQHHLVRSTIVGDPWTMSDDTSAHADPTSTNSTTDVTSTGSTTNLQPFLPDSSSAAAPSPSSRPNNSNNNNSTNSNTKNNSNSPASASLASSSPSPLVGRSRTERDRGTVRSGTGNNDNNSSKKSLDLEEAPALLVSQIGMTTAATAATTTGNSDGGGNKAHHPASSSPPRAPPVAAIISAKTTTTNSTMMERPPPSPQQQRKKASSSLHSRSNSSPNRIPRYHQLVQPPEESSSYGSSPVPTTTTTTTTVPNKLAGPKDVMLFPPVGGGATTTLNKHGIVQGQQQAQLRRVVGRDSHHHHHHDLSSSSQLQQEQALFEQRLCGDDTLGVAVRKINQNGKANLRYVKCVTLSKSSDNNHEGVVLDAANKSTTKSLSSSRSAGGSGWRRHKTATNTTCTTPPHQRPSVTDPATGGGEVVVENSNHAASPSSSSCRRALVWGKKKDISIPLNRFTAVRKGKTTDRARRNTSLDCHVLSILINDPSHPSLDIEAPTKMDRDKFARAFAKFLNVPLLEGNEAQQQEQHSNSDYSGGAVAGATAAAPLKPTPTPSSNNSSSLAADAAAVAADLGDLCDPIKPEKETVESIPAMDSGAAVFINSNKSNDEPGVVVTGGFWQGAVAAAATAREMSNNSSLLTQPNTTNPDTTTTPRTADPPSTPAVAADSIARAAAVVAVATTLPKEGGGGGDEKEAGDNGSELSSLTGHGYDQELVEELHHALNELRGELEESRAEAARAVKVAEQAIQSAEKSNSMEWQNTVTHKAAEAAAQAQKRSAEAMAKQRLAEERLEGERRTAAFWRKQAEVAEEEAGILQTRAAAAEVQRAAFEEQLGSERRLAAGQLDGLKRRLGSLEMHQRDALEDAMERNRALEIELDSARRDLSNKDHPDDVENAGDANPRNGTGTSSMRRKLSLIGRKKKSAGVTDSADSKTLLSSNMVSSSSELVSNAIDGGTQQQQQQQPLNSLLPDQLLKVQAETAVVRQQFELLRRATAAELQTLPELSKIWTQQVSETLEASQTEVVRLRDHLAIESASRRKLLHEVQDLRGIVRVYCRPRPPLDGVGTLSMPSREALVLRREQVNPLEESTGPTSFEFDHVFDPGAPQRDVYAEMENVCLGVLDGYNICIMAYGQSGCGKTKTLLGDLMTDRGQISIENHGIQLQAMKQLFSIAEQRCERYKDTFTFTVVEVCNERISDLLAGTQSAENRGQVIVADASSSGRRKSQKGNEDDASSGKQARLEIRTDVHGDTVVQGTLSLEVENFEQVVEIWEECLANRRNRLVEQEVDISQYEASCNVIATLKVTSANITTGHGSVGKLQFVDLAGADLAPRQSSIGEPSQDTGAPITVGPNSDMRFAYRSLETLSEVVTARAQYVRTVPYRNSTLTHLLRDSLEADTKVLLITCISSDIKDIQETAAALRFAARMRHVTIGKATKHTLSPP